jgi:hypothetical protein
MACCLAHMKPTVVVFITVSDIGSASCLVRRCAMGFSYGKWMFYLYFPIKNGGFP